jgi:hypothetical protein
MLALAACYVVLLNVPAILFPHHVREGRLTLYSDQPFEAARGRALLRNVAARLATSPLDDGKPHSVAIANTEWRRRLMFNRQGGASGVNYYPVTAVVFLRHADVATDRQFGASGRPAAPPRTLTYYMAHEITHSLTAEHLGPGQLWNQRLPQWVREGYADYVGMGGKVDIAELHRRQKAGEPELSFARSHTYAEFRLLAAYMLERRGWTVEQLLASKLTAAQAQALMESAPP